MNILHLIFSFNVGGAEKLLVDIVNNWQDTDDSLHLCIINDDYDSTLLDELTQDNVTIHLLHRVPKSSKLSKTKAFRKIIKANKIQVIHCHNNNSFKYLVISGALRMHHRTFLTVHDTNIYNSIAKTDIMLHKLFLTKLITISKSVEKSIKDINKKKSFTTIVYNGVDTEKFTAGIRKKTDKKQLICVARIVPEKKGQDVLVKAVSKLNNKKDIICSFAGGNPSGEDNIAKLELMAKDLGVEENIQFLGNRSDISQLLSQSDIFILPSNYEGFGIVIIEAMLAKVPVIASDIDGPKELITDGVNGFLFRVGDHDDLAEKIEAVLNNDNSELIELAYRRAVNEFSIAKMIQQLKHVYAGDTAFRKKM